MPFLLRGAPYLFQRVSSQPGKKKKSGRKGSISGRKSAVTDRKGAVVEKGAVTGLKVATWRQGCLHGNYFWLHFCGMSDLRRAQRSILHTENLWAILQKSANELQTVPDVLQFVGGGRRAQANKRSIPLES